MTRHKRNRRISDRQTLSPVALALVLIVAFSSSRLLLARVGEGSLKPKRMSAEERDRIKEENRVREQVGESIGRTCEALSEADQECDFAALKEQALDRLGIAAMELYEEREETEEASQLVCFDASGTVTNDRSQCAADQSGFFGMPEAEEEEDMDEDYDYGYGRPSEDDMMQYYGGYTSPAPTSEPMNQTGGGAPDVSMIRSMMEMMATMMPKLRTVIGYFEEAGVDVPEESRRVAENAIATFARLRGPCEEGDMKSCMELADMAGGIEWSMRPPMERAMQNAIMAGTISFERMQQTVARIETLMSEGMPSHTMSPPPGMMQQGGGYGMPQQGYGSQGGNGMSPGFNPMMQQGFPQGGYPYGMPQQGYGSQGGNGMSPGFNPMMQQGFPQGGYPYGMPQQGYGSYGY